MNHLVGTGRGGIKEMPKVSVILTSFNHAKYLCEAIDSVLGQTFSDFELIIWDDASSDDSWSIIRGYHDPRIKSFRNDKQRRAVYGINKAIREVAQGEYIAIHHSDDVWEPEKLAKQAAFLEANSGIGAVFTWVNSIDEHGVETNEEWFNRPNRNRWGWLNELFNEENHLNHPSVLIRRQCYEEVGLYKYGLAQTGDAEMWSRVLLSFPIHVIPEKLTKHRLFSDKSNMSGQRPEVLLRLNNEWNHTRENFLRISNVSEVYEIFPELPENWRAPDGEIKFLLAMACLQLSQKNNAWQLGMSWLFELVNDAVARQKILALYGFSYIDLIRITSQYDVYSFDELVNLKGQIANLNQAVAERDGQIANLNQAVAERDGQIAVLLSSRTKPNKRCSVVIPTKNGGALFVRALEELQHQSIWDDVELIVIDSGSTDGTIEAARKAGAKVIEIAPEDFNHGATRDYGIFLARCEIVVLMVQDAVPYDMNLLEDILQPLNDPEVAGVYVRQIPQQNADLLTKRNLNNWLTGRTISEVRKIESVEWYESLSPMEKYIYCNFDNVCSAIRKSVWEKHKFGKINFGEDIDWAERVLKSGYKIAYEPSAVVIHSHDRPLSYEYKRTYVCHRKLYSQFRLHMVPSLGRALLSWLFSTGRDVKYVYHQEARISEKLVLWAKIPLLNFLSAIAQYCAARDEAAGTVRHISGV